MINAKGNQMTPIYKSEKYRVESEGNGARIQVVRLADGASLFLQDDDAALFMEEVGDWLSEERAERVIQNYEDAFVPAADGAPRKTEYFIHIKTGRLFELISRDGASVQFAPQGGGFVLSAPPADFDRDFKASAPDEGKYFPATVTAEWLEDGNLKLDCYSNFMVWNGWGMPFFDEEAARKLSQMLPNLRYDGERDLYISKDEGTNDEDEYPATLINVEGRTVKTYAIGSGYWTWDRCEKSSPRKPSPRG